MKVEHQVGAVKYWNAGRGFGFLTLADRDGGDVFLHISEAAEELREGDRVEFILGLGPHGRPRDKGAEGEVMALYTDSAEFLRAVFAASGPAGVALACE